MDPRPEEIAIYLGPGWEAFSPLDIETKGLGGSETATVRLAEQLSALGHAIAVYGEVEESNHGDVAYRPHATFDPAEQRLAVISSRRPELFDQQVNARSRLLWMHDTDCGAELSEGRAERIDHVLVLSRWHRDHMRDIYPFLESKLCQIRNGIEVGYFEGEAPKRSPRLLYTSAPDRGLDILLEMWPQVRERAPEAELGFCCTGVYGRIAEEVPHVARHRAHCIDLAEASEGTHDFGALSQPDLARLMRASTVWAHPSWSTPDGVPFRETSCIGAMEAQMAGCLVVASATAALPETVRVGRLVGGEPLSPRWRETFVEEICAGLSDEATQSWAQREGPAVASDLGWEDVAKAVASLIDAERPAIDADHDFAVAALGSLAEALVGTLEVGTHTTWPVAEARVIGATESGVAIQAQATNPEAPSESLLLSIDLDSELSVANIEPASGRPADAVMEVEVDRGMLRIEQPGPHRFVLSDASGSAIEASPRFWLTGAGETCGGIALIGERLLLVFDTPGGVRLAALELDQAMAMLEPLDAALGLSRRLARS